MWPVVLCLHAFACGPAPALISGPPAPTPEDWEAYRRVRISSAVTVDGCEYLGDFVGSGSDRPGGMQRDVVRLAAAKRGATDIVFDYSTRTDLVARGYRCSWAVVLTQDAGDVDAAR
jgi:hypothetical protein